MRVNGREWTPLHSAAFCAHVESVKKSVQASADIEAQTVRRWDGVAHWPGESARRGLVHPEWWVGRGAYMKCARSG
jgi:hypothetical protein